MIARLEKSFYGIEALMQLESDTEPLSDSSGPASSRDPCPSTPSSHDAPAPRGLSRVPDGTTEPPRPPANRSDTDSESVRQRGITKKRKMDSSTDSSHSNSEPDSSDKSLTASSKRRKKASDVDRQTTGMAIEVNRESTDKRKAARERKEKTKKTGKDLWNRDP